MKEQFIRTDKHGDKFYYSDKEMTILHREYGPAIEWEDGDKEWYIDGEHLTEEEFNARNKVEFTLDEIADKLGVSVDQLKIKK